MRFPVAVGFRNGLRLIFPGPSALLYPAILCCMQPVITDARTVLVVDDVELPESPVESFAWLMFALVDGGGGKA